MPTVTLESSSLHGGNKGNIHNTKRSLEHNVRPFTRQILKDTIKDNRKLEDLPRHLHCLAVPNNQEMSRDIITIDSRSRTGAEPAAAEGSAEKAWHSECLPRNLNLSPIIDPDETFISPKPKRVKRSTKWAQFIPENLRDMPKPEWMVERDAEREVEDANNEQNIWQEVIRRNMVAKRAVVDLPTKQLLTLELADHETTGETILARDVARDPSSLYSDSSAHQNCAQFTKKPLHWRWFLEAPRNAEIGRSHGEEKGERESSLAFPGGELIPVVGEWYYREQFVMNRKQIQHGEEWLAERVTEALKIPYKVVTSDPDWLSGELPASGTRKQWQDHPKDLAYRRTPLEYGSMDWSTVSTLPPMKDTYYLAPERRTQCAEISVRKFCEDLSAVEKEGAEGEGQCSLEPEEKEKRRLEADEKEEHRLAAEEEEKRRLEAKEKNRLCREAQRAEEADRERKEKRQRSWPGLLAKFSSKVDIYIRPVMASDAVHITAIYNHYIHNSIQADDLEETSVSHWRDRLHQVTHEKLTFLVAVLKTKNAAGGHSNTGRAGKGADWDASIHCQDAVGVVSEAVVGFAFSEFLSTRNSRYRHAVRLHLYVDPNFIRQGVGRNLLDRIMPSLDVAYTTKSATDFIVAPNANPGIQWYRTGGSKEVRKIQVNIAYTYGGEQEMEWRKRFLQYWEFDHVGRMNCMGEKFGEPLNIAIMLRETAMTTTGCSTWYQKEPPRITHMARQVAKEADGPEDAANFT